MEQEKYSVTIVFYGKNAETRVTVYSDTEDARFFYDYCLELYIAFTRLFQTEGHVYNVSLQYNTDTVFRSTWFHLHPWEPDYE